jgi:hypothetical protein
MRLHRSSPMAPRAPRGPRPPVGRRHSRSSLLALLSRLARLSLLAPATLAPFRPASAQGDSASGGGPLLAAYAGAALRDAPDGRQVAAAAAGTTLVPIARQRGWVRVRLEGWVRDDELLPADSALRSGLSAADLRADPAGTRGTIVRWEVEKLALQTADPLRGDLGRDEPYLLARGPGRENALLYIAVPPSLVADARALPPLARVTITARVRNGRSDPAGVPVLELLSLARR